MNILARPNARDEVSLDNLPNEQHLVLYDVSWDAYEMIGEALRDRPALRLTYDQGTLEIMTTSQEHERYKTRLGRILDTLAEEFGLRIEPAGNMTFKRRRGRRGLEPDQCYWIANEAVMRTKQAWDPEHDPPPDLFVEIEISRNILNRLRLCAKLRVPEVWRFDGESIRARQLQPAGTYREYPESPTFPGIPLMGIVPFLKPSETLDYLSMVRAFRDWVRGQRSSEKGREQSSGVRPKKRRKE